MDVYLKEILKEDALLWVVAMLVGFGIFVYVESDPVHGLGLIVGGAIFAVVRSILKRNRMSS